MSLPRAGAETGETPLEGSWGAGERKVGPVVGGHECGVRRLGGPVGGGGAERAWEWLSAVCARWARGACRGGHESDFVLLGGGPVRFGGRGPACGTGGGGGGDKVGAWRFLWTWRCFSLLSARLSVGVGRERFLGFGGA